MLFDPQTNNFYLQNHRQLNFNNMQWKNVVTLPNSLTELSYPEAVKKLQGSPHKLKMPIGVIGANKPTQEQYQIAEKIGNALAQLNVFVICGGRGGVMEAVCKGVDEAGGTSIGILPESHLENANKFVTIPVTTGIGLARNSIIATSALCLIAIGGSYGTLTEIAYGLHFGKKVFTINSDLKVDHAIICNTIEEVVNNVCKVIFNI